MLVMSGMLVQRQSIDNIMAKGTKNIFGVRDYSEELKNFKLTSSEDIQPLVELIKKNGGCSEKQYKNFERKAIYLPNSKVMLDMLKDYVHPIILELRRNAKNTVKNSNTFPNRHEEAKNASEKVYKSSDFVFSIDEISCGAFKLFTKRAFPVRDSILSLIERTFKIKASIDNTFYFDPPQDLSVFLSLIEEAKQDTRKIKIAEGIEYLSKYGKQFIDFNIKQIKDYISTSLNDYVLPADCFVYKNHSHLILSTDHLSVKCVVDVNISKSDAMLLARRYTAIHANNIPIAEDIVASYYNAYPEILYDFSDDVRNKISRQDKSEIRFNFHLSPVYAVSDKFYVNFNNDDIKIEAVDYSTENLKFSKEDMAIIKEWSDKIRPQLPNYYKEIGKIMPENYVYEINFDIGDKHPFRETEHNISSAYLFMDYNIHASDDEHGSKGLVQCVLIERNMNRSGDVLFTLYTSDPSKCVYNFRCKNKYRKLGIFAICTYFTSRMPNKREDIYHGWFKLFNVEFLFKSIPLVITPQINESIKSIQVPKIEDKSIHIQFSYKDDEA